MITNIILNYILVQLYSFDVEGDSDGDPVEVVVHDIPLMLLCLVYAMCMFSLLYILR